MKPLNIISDLIFYVLCNLYIFQKRRSAINHMYKNVCLDDLDALITPRVYFKKKGSQEITVR